MLDRYLPRAFPELAAWPLRAGKAGYLLQDGNSACQGPESPVAASSLFGYCTWHGFSVDRGPTVRGRLRSDHETWRAEEWVEGGIMADIMQSDSAPATDAGPFIRPGEPAHVVVLMATYNGAAHVRAQLDSLLAQDHTDWSLIASDDGSEDETVQILIDFSRACPDRMVTIVSGPQKGAAANFLSLLCRAPRFSRPGSFIAFSDQDDFWLPERLSRGISAMAPQSDGPAAWCSRTLITGPTLGAGRLTPPRHRPLCFRNALVQNVMHGNTILLNPAAASLVCHLAQGVEDIILHDWWVYQVMTGAGAPIIHDDRPSLLYRQHGKNQIGANDSRLEHLSRFVRLLSGSLRRQNRANLAALNRARPYLTAENAEILGLLAQAHDGGLLTRIRAVRQAGLYRQTRISTAAMWLAVILGLF